MNEIELRQVLPQVFRGNSDIHSDVWMSDVKLSRGNTYLVEANSGTGKSSLCSYIFGYRHDYDGDILFDGEDICKYKVSQWVNIRRSNIALLWQELRLFPELTAMENVLIKNNLTHFQSESQINTWFEMLGIAEKRGAKIGRMSFGQQQRVAMIRTLCQPFDFVFVDEPISHLDDDNSNIMADILTTEAKRQGAGVIVTSIGKHMEIHYDTILKL